VIILGQQESFPIQLPRAKAGKAIIQLDLRLREFGFGVHCQKGTGYETSGTVEDLTVGPLPGLDSRMAVSASVRMSLITGNRLVNIQPFIASFHNWILHIYPYLVLVHPSQITWLNGNEKAQYCHEPGCCD
jgi:hypothetical protein